MAVVVRIIKSHQGGTIAAKRSSSGAGPLDGHMRAQRLSGISPERSVRGCVRREGKNGENKQTDRQTTTEKKGGWNVERLLRDSPLVRWVLQRLRALREQGRKSCSGSATGEEEEEERRKEGK